MSGVVSSYRSKKSWRIWFQIDGKQQFALIQKREFPDKLDARREALRRESGGELPVDIKVSFAEFAKGYAFKKPWEESTQERFGFTALSFARYLEAFHPGITYLKEITSEVMSGYVSERRKQYSPAGVNVDLRYLHQIFNAAASAGIFKVSPLKGIPYLKEEKIVKELPTEEEVEAIVRWFKINQPQLFPWIYLEATRGWRRDELRKMQVCDVDLKSRVLYVRNTKTKVQRKEPLKEDDCLILSEHFLLLKKRHLYKEGGLLFPSRNGLLVGKNKMLEYIQRKACPALGIKKNITNHLFRHLVVTTLMNKTGNIETVKAVTGHKDTRTILEHYLHTSPEMVKKALEITKVDVGLLKPMQKSKQIKES